MLKLRSSPVPSLSILAAVVAVAGCADTDIDTRRDDGPVDPVAVAGLTSQLAQTLGVDEDDIVDLVAPDIDPAELAAFRSFCSTQADLDETSRLADAPPLLALPSTASSSTLPHDCDEAARLAALVDDCGPLTPSTTQAADRLDDALAGCVAGTTCHVVLPAGDFIGGADFGCAFIEGAGAATRIHGVVSGAGILARVSVDDAYTPIQPYGALLVNEAVVVGGYEGLSISWEADYDVAVCRSQIAGGYSGAGQSWASHKLVVAGSSVAACYEAVSSSWGSEQLLAQENILFAGHSGVSIHHSLASIVVGNAIASDNEAVGVSQWDQASLNDLDGDGEPDADGEDPYTPVIVGVLVRDNVVYDGTLPESDPAADIIIDN